MKYRRTTPGQRLSDYLETHGLSPVKDDLRFVTACLERIPSHAHEWAVSRYAGAWKEAVEQAAGGNAPAHQHQNIGRRAANSWIRSVLERKRLTVPSGLDMKQVRL